MDAVADLGAEHVVHKLVLGDPAEAGERRRTDARLEVVPVAGHVGLGAGDSSLDPMLDFIRRNGHSR